MVYLRYSQAHRLKFQTRHIPCDKSLPMGVSVLDVGLVFGVAKTCYPTFGKRIMKTCQYSKTPLVYTFYWSIKTREKDFKSGLQFYRSRIHGSPTHLGCEICMNGSLDHFLF